MESKEIYRKIFTAIKAGSIDDVLKAAYEVFGMPVSVCDDTFQMLTKNYPPVPQNDECWDVPLKEQKVPLDIVKLFQEHDIIDMHEQSPHKPIYLNWGWFETRPRITTAVWIDQAIAGYIAVLCPTEHYEAWHDEALLIVSDAIAIVLQREQIDCKGSNVILKSFVKELIMGNILTLDELQKWETLTDIRIKGDFLMLAISHTGTDKKGSESYLRNQLKRLTPYLLMHTTDNVIYGLLYNQCSGKSSDQSLATLIEMIHSLESVCGISCRFSLINEVSLHREQALIALNTGRRLEPENNHFAFSDFALPSILLCSMDKIQTKNCIHPALFRLADYDLENNTDYFTTLKFYIANHHSTHIVCEKMHIHRNTLMYRLKKLEEITGINVQDSPVDAHLLVSFKILELAETLKASHFLRL